MVFGEQELVRTMTKKQKTLFLLKFGCADNSTFKDRDTAEMFLRKFSINICVNFAIRCAKKVYTEPTWNAWADKWLDGSDRTKESAYAAYAAAADATPAAAAAAWAVAAAAAWAVAYAYAANADAANAAAAASAWAAADAYAAAAYSKKRINFIALLEQAYEGETDGIDTGYKA